MNYYERHLGDYARDAGHLTMLEHGAYTLLLDRYYTTEQGIPEDQAHRICRARTRDERAAVDAVLAEFFRLVDGAWHNGRCDREVTKMQAKVKAAQENGKRGGRPKATNQEPTGFSPGSESVTQTKAHQSPVTITAEAKASDADASASEPESQKAALWRESVVVLKAGGCPESLCRSFMGKLVKDYGEPAVREAVTAAISAQPADAREYLKATCQRLKGERRDPITVPSTDTRAEQFKAAMDERAAVAVKPPAHLLALAGKAVRTA